MQEARADRGAINITLNSFGGPLNEPSMRSTDRRRLYPAIGALYPEATNAFQVCVHVHVSVCNTERTYCYMTCVTQSGARFVSRLFFREGEGVQGRVCITMGNALTIAISHVHGWCMDGPSKSRSFRVVGDEIDQDRILRWIPELCPY